MLRYFILLPLALSLCSCTTTPGGSSAADRIAAIAGDAATIGTMAYLTAHPEQRSAFVLGESVLTGLIDKGNASPADLATALQGLPISTFKGVNGELYIEGALIVWDQLSQSASRIDKQQLVGKTLLAVRDGLRRALNEPPLPPPSSTPPSVVLPTGTTP